MTEKESKKGKKRTGKLLSSFVVLTIVLSVLGVTMLPASAQPTVTRSIDPDTVSPGDVVDVTISFTTTEDMGLFPALQDVVPEGWVATDMSAVPGVTGSNFTDHTVGFIWPTLGTGVAVTASYKLHVPGDAAGGVYPLNGALYKLGSHYADVTGECNVTVAGPVYGVDLTVDQAERTVAPNENATYTLTVKNTGNTGDTFDIAIDNVPAGATATLSEGVTPELAPDGTYDVSLNVSSAIEDEYIVNVTATSQGDPSKSDKVTTKTNVSLDLPDLIVTEITPNCDYLFANESNNINATIKNNGTAAASAFNVSFVIDGFRKEVRVSGLAPGANTTKCVNDPTLRNAGDLVSINVTADCNGEVSELNETNNWMNISKTVMNNGYKSKSFAGLPSLVLHEYGKFNGSIVYTVGNSSKVELEPANTTTTGFDITIPGGATVRTARLYVYWYDSWYSAVHGDADLEVTFDGHSFTTPGASYTDGKGFGSYNYPKGTYAYDVTSDVSGTGTYTATIENTAADTNTMLTGQLLLVVYEDATEPEMEYWITEGCDLLKADSNYCVSPAEAIANVTFEGTIDVTNKSARLITVVAQGNELGTDLSFNDKIWEDVWQVPAGNSKIDIDDRSVTSWLNPSDNVADFRDTGTMGMQASNAILVVEHVVEYNFTIDFVTGYNMISMPLNDTSVTNASTLIAKIGANCTDVFKWNKTSQGWENYNPSMPPAAAFNIIGGEGYLVSMSGPETVVFRGMGWESPFSMSLVTGYNMIGIPVNDTSVTNASLLIDEIGTNCTDVFKWNKTSQGWENYNPSMPPAAAFNIGCGEGYFVSMVGPADVTFVGEPCQD